MSTIKGLPKTLICIKSHIVNTLIEFEADYRIFPNIIRDIFYVTARLFTSKRVGNSFLGKKVNTFQRFLCVWSKPTAIKRKWMLFRQINN